MKSGLQRKERMAGYLFLLPNLAGFLVITAFPIIAGFYLSFTNYDGFRQMDFVGLDNYIRMFRDDYFTISLKNNLVYTFSCVPLTIFLALMFALALNQRIPGKTLFKTVYFFPTITSMVAVSIIWSMLFHPTMGPINTVLMAMGIKNPPKWLVSSDWAMVAVIAVSVWKMAGYYMIMILAGLQSIPRHLYEAADIDGANAWKKFWNVTWPMLSPTMFMVTILCMIQSFQVFDLVYIMTEGGPGRATNVLVYRIYQEGFTYLKYGYASALAYVLFLIIFVITLIQFRGQKKWVTYMQ